MRRLVGLAVLALLQLACSRSPQWYVERGNRLAAAGKYSAAELEYRHSIQDAPDFAEGYYRLGVLEYQLRHGDEALDDLQQAVSRDPKNDRYGIELASMAIEAFQLVPARANLYKIAADEADHLLKEDPNSFDGLRLRGDVLVADRKYADAEAVFRKANQLKPNDPDLVLARAQILMAEHDERTAERLAEGFLAARKDYPPIYDLLAKYYVQTKRVPDAEHLLQEEIAALPKYAPARLQLAKLYQASGEQQEMAQVLEKLLADRAAFPLGPSLVGDFYAGLGQWDNALAQYRTGLEHAVEADKAGYHEKMEHAFEALGKRREALGETEEILRTNPQDKELRLRRARLLEESADAQDRETAREALKTLSRQYPDDAAVHYNLALSYWVGGEASLAWPEAAKSAELARNYAAPRILLARIALKAHNPAAAIDAAQEVLVLDPDNAAARLARAEALTETRSYGLAGSELEALEKLQPNSEAVELAAAQLAAAQKNYSKAEVLYRRVYHPGSADLAPLESLVSLCVQEGQPEKAETLLGEELKQYPDSRPLRMLLAWVAAGEGKFDLAREQYRWLASQEPQSAQPYTALGDLYQREGKTEEAIANYRKASELAPRDAKIWNAVAVLESDNGRPRQAIQALDQELALDPNDTAAMNNLAFNLAETGQNLDRALSLAETVARKFPAEPGVLDTLGWVYAKRGLDQSAIRILSSLVKKYPQEPAYHYHLGVVLLDAKQTNAGKRELLAALSEHPTGALSDKIQDHLKRLP
jgi:tetratricopeptide (TPR) repeat protein